MSFDNTDPNYPAMAAMVNDQFGVTPNLDIAAGDEMYAFSEINCGSRILGLMAYFRAGIQINDAVRQLIRWHFGDPSKITAFLDFAAGYGRSTRFLRHDLPAESVWMSEILPDALEFQERQLGVRTIPSHNVPEKFRPGQRFDFIFVSSLFSHLPESTFSRWLATLYNLLSPGGLLVFSVHNELTLPPDVAMPASGIHFIPSTEIPSLDVADYGATIVADHFVRTAIKGATGAESQRVPQGLCFTQDLYLVANGPMKSGPVPFQYGPNGCVDFCRRVEPDRMKLTGWAFDATEGQKIKRVEVYYNGILRGACELNHYRPDVAAYLGHSDRPEAVRSGWDCSIDLQGEQIRPEQDWILAKAVSTNGREFVLRLDHPANVSEFNLQGWTYSNSIQNSKAIVSALRFIEHPRDGRFTTADLSISGWVAANDPESMAGLRLQGRFGSVPFTVTDRPDVLAAFPGFSAIGFQAVLPSEYLTVLDPRLRFIAQSGEVLAILDTISEPSASLALEHLTGKVTNQ